jgi:hypothetical protein
MHIKRLGQRINMAKITNSVDIKLQIFNTLVKGSHKIVTEGMNLKTGEQNNLQIWGTRMGKMYKWEYPKKDDDDPDNKN